MRPRSAGLLLLAAAMLAGCAALRGDPAGPGAEYFARHTGPIGVVVAELPDPDTAFPGADCASCLASASSAERALTSAVRRWPTRELQTLQDELVAALNARAQRAQAIDGALRLAALPDRAGAGPGHARKDFSRLRGDTGVERLLVVNVYALGAWRDYTAHAPAGAPRAVFKADAYIVDLKDHRLDWFQSFDLSRTAVGAWDEAPNYPALADAHRAVVAQGKAAIRKAFER